MKKINYVFKIKKFLKNNTDKVSEELSLYLVSKILPYYKKNDKAHNVDHAYYVLKRSFNFAKTLNEKLDYNIITTLAIFHDVKYHISMEHHEELAANDLRNDNTLKKFFTLQQLKNMYKTLKYHDSKQNQKELDIYAKILRTADCDISLKTLLKRMHQFRLIYAKNMSLKEKIDDSYNYFFILFDKDGLSINKTCFYDKDFEKMLKKTKQFIKNKKYFIKYYKKVNGLK
ncbi:MAG: hypothetical protein IJW25_02730 [Clostridia bacterium]|nr:hypothetical protein [Clostridia bacterium]